MAVKSEFKALGLLLMMTVFLALIPSIVKAAEALPDVKQLQDITMSKSVLWAPGRLATGSDGTLYVVDSYRNHILKFDRNGSYVGDIPFPRVSAIAVAPDGTLYIGSHQNYSVSIIKNGQVTGHLGAEQNEFRSIRDIAVDSSTGLVYVADNVGNAVRIFDAAGNDRGSIGGVNLPIGIEVTADAIYVIDAPVVPGLNSNTTASRICVFDKAYNLTNTIDDYGKNQMFSPTDITVLDGILYVTDAAAQSVLLFDEAGAYLGDIQSVAGNLNTAVALTMSADRMLYVSSSETHTIHIFSITAGVSGAQGGQQ